MTKPHSYLIKDMVELYTELYGDEDTDFKVTKQYFKAFLDTIMILVTECRVGDKVKLVGFGVFEICPPRKMPGSFRHFKTNQLISKEQTSPRIRFTPSIQMKKMLKEKSRGDK